MPADDPWTQHAQGALRLRLRLRPLCLSCLLAPFAWLAAPHRAAAAADPKPEVIFQLPLAPSGVTVTPDGGFIIAVSFEEKPQNRVIAVGRNGESKPFPTVPLSQAAPGESILLDAITGLQCMDNGIVWMLDNGRRSELPPKIIAWDSAHARLQRVYNLAPPAVLPSSQLDDLAVDPERPF